MNHQPSTGLNESLAKITKGAGIAFFGSIVGLGLAFLARVMVARIGTEAEYGIFSLAFVILNIASTIGAFGLREGASRSIAFARGVHDDVKVKSLVHASIQLAIIISVPLAIVIFALSDIVSTDIFDDPELAFPLRVFAIAIPFITSIMVLSAIFLGFDNTRPRAYFQDILRGGLFVVLLLVVLAFDLDFKAVFFAYLATLICCGIMIYVYTIKRLTLKISPRRFLSFNSITRELAIFSLPLLGTTIFGMIAVWMDTLMLGGFSNSEEVGLYSAAHPLAQLLSVPMIAIALIYVPVASGLYSRGELPQIQSTFGFVTKWLFIGTIPLIMVLLLFPQTVVSSLFGASYSESATALRLLAIGFASNILAGPNTAGLVALGRSNFLLGATMVAALINIGLNIALIPAFGMEGAAVATMSSLIFINCARGAKLYVTERIHPFSTSYMKAGICGIFMMVAFGVFLRELAVVSWWVLPLILVVFYMLCILSLMLTRSLDTEDVDMLTAMGRKAGFSPSVINAIKKLAPSSGNP